MNYYLIAVSGIVLSFIFIKFALYFFPKWNLIDKPQKYGLKRMPIPYFGGITIILSFVLGILFWLTVDFKLLILLALIFFVGIISFVDDKKGLSPFIRLSMQLLLGVVLYFVGIKIQTLPNPLGIEFNLLSIQFVGVAIFSLLATVIWVVLIMNSINWVDGLNGLTSGISSIAFFIIFLLSIKPGLHTIDQSVVATMALLLSSIILVFCFFDFYPAKILMGDTGTMFIGFMIASLSIYAGGKLATALLVLGVPIIDAIWTIFRRILSGQSPVKGDLKHLHHRFLNAGFSDRQVLIIYYLITLIFGLLALFLNNTQKVWAILGLIAFMSTLVLAVVLLDIEKSRKKD